MNKWQPIKTAPRDGSRFIAITEQGEYCVMNFDHYSEGIVRTVTCRRCSGMGLGDLAHWIALPKPPNIKPIKKGFDNE